MLHTVYVHDATPMHAYRWANSNAGAWNVTSVNAIFYSLYIQAHLFCLKEHRNYCSVRVIQGKKGSSK